MKVIPDDTPFDIHLDGDYVVQAIMDQLGRDGRVFWGAKPGDRAKAKISMHEDGWFVIHVEGLRG